MPEVPLVLGSGTPAGAAPGSVLNTGGSGRSSGNVALLLPLTGNLATVGQTLANAAKLALPDGGTPSLDIRDTGGTAQGAAAAAQSAIAAGDGVILGPLTSAETHAVAPIAQAAGVNMLAFTNDSAVAAPGVWALGITPAQQVQRVLKAAADSGHNQLAALLPDTDFGHSLASAITAAAPGLGEGNPRIVFYDQTFHGVDEATRDVSDFADRGAGIEAEIKAAKALDTPEGRAKARELSHRTIPPPPFNALFVGAADENTLAALATFLPYYDVSPSQTELLGPALWSTVAPKMANRSVYLGAIYAAPDPSAAATFQAKYSTAYGSAPPAIADVAYDAAALAHLAAQNGGYTTNVLTTPAGFTGADGVLVLQPGGQVLRGLAVMQVAPGQPVVAAPAPTQLSPPAS